MLAFEIIFAESVDLKAARDARLARPFQGRLLKAVAAQLDPAARAAVRLAIADGVAGGKTTAEVTRLVRDHVRVKARAAL